MFSVLQLKCLLMLTLQSECVALISFCVLTKGQIEHFHELHLCIPGFTLVGLCWGGGGTFAFTSTYILQVPWSLECYHRWLRIDRLHVRILCHCSPMFFHNLCNCWQPWSYLVFRASERGARSQHHIELESRGAL